MMPLFIQAAALVLLVATCLFLVLRPDWRGLLTALLATYFLAFIFLFYTTSVLIAAVDLAFGWISASMLGYALARSEVEELQEGGRASGSGFRLISGFFFVLTGFALSISTGSWLPGLQYLQVSAGLVLVLNGILLLNYFPSPQQVFGSLLLLLAGFELVYIPLEQSLLLVALLGAVKIGLALTAVYSNWDTGRKPG